MTHRTSDLKGDLLVPETITKINGKELRDIRIVLMTKANLRKLTNLQFGRLLGMKNPEPSVRAQISNWERGVEPIPARICAAALALQEMSAKKIVQALKRSTK